MARLRPHLDAQVLLGVGAAFDIHAGLLRQAPPVLQRAGLEWLFRLAMEPRRLWRRYLRNNPAFLFALAGRSPHLIDTTAPRVAQVRGKKTSTPRPLRIEPRDLAWPSTALSGGSTPTPYAVTRGKATQTHQWAVRARGA